MTLRAARRSKGAKPQEVSAAWQHAVHILRLTKALRKVGSIAPVPMSRPQFLVHKRRGSRRRQLRG